MWFLGVWTEICHYNTQHTKRFSVTVPSFHFHHHRNRKHHHRKIAHHVATIQHIVITRSQRYNTHHITHHTTSHIKYHTTSHNTFHDMTSPHHIIAHKLLFTLFSVVMGAACRPSPCHFKPTNFHRLHRCVHMCCECCVYVLYMLCCECCTYVLYMLCVVNVV